MRFSRSDGYNNSSAAIVVQICWCQRKAKQGAELSLTQLRSWDAGMGGILDPSTISLARAVCQRKTVFSRKMLCNYSASLPLNDDFALFSVSSLPMNVLYLRLILERQPSLSKESCIFSIDCSVDVEG